MSKYYKDTLDKTLDLTKYMDYLVKSAKNPSIEFMGRNTLYKKVGRNREVKIAPPIQEMAAIVENISDQLEDVNKSNASLSEKIKLRQELLQKFIKPKQIITLSEEDDYWWGDTLDGINLRFGLVDNDWSRPAIITLDSNQVHVKAGGETGQGKSVMDDCILMSLNYEYPPWELQIYFIDAKMAEGGKYSSMYRVPTIKDIGMTGAGSYAVTVYEHIAKELTSIYNLNAKLGVNTLKGLRNILDMAIPRVLLVHDELAETRSRSTQKELDAMDKTLKTLINQGRASGDHVFLITQIFKGVIDNSLQTQFGVGFSVGANDEISEDILGNNAAMELKKKRGYCIGNYKRNIKNNKDFNVEAKVAFCPVDEEEGQSKFMTMLKNISDFSDSKGYAERSTSFSEDASTLIKDFDIDYRKVFNLAQIEIENHSYHNLITILLGDGLTYTGNSEIPKEYLIWNYEKKSNLFLHTQDVNNLMYMSRMVAKALESSGKKFNQYAIIDKAQIYRDDILETLTWQKDYSGDFNISQYTNDIKNRKLLIRYANICRGKEKPWNFIEFLEYLDSKNLIVNSDTFKEFKDLFNIVVFEKALRVVENLIRTQRIFNLNSNCLILQYLMNKENRDFFLEFQKWLFIYNFTKSRITGDYLKPEDLPVKIFWFFNPSSNDGIKDKYGGFTDEFNTFLTDGPEVGIFSIIIAEEFDGKASTIKCCKHLIASTVHSSVEKTGLVQFKENEKMKGRLFSYTQCEDTIAPVVYFKKYYVGKDLTNIKF